ncbi:hypothetical protein JTM05_39105, partial [Pseudomonas aeruginosa]|nr:hypothetical protein [Pseudomonas aeruginosa]
RAAAGPGWQLAHQTAPVRSAPRRVFPLVDAFRSRSGPDAEDYQWLMHQARPALSVDEARLDGYWLRIDSLQSNALVLYEFTPQSPTAP